MKCFSVKLCRFNNDIVYLNRVENKTGTAEEPFKYYYEPIVEYEETFEKSIIISIDKKGIAHEIVTNIEIPVVFKDQIVSYDHDNFKYTKTFRNIIPSKGDVHTFAVINRTVYNDFRKTVYNANEATYDEVEKYINSNMRRKSEYQEELISIFDNNLKRVIEYKEKIEETENDRNKIKKLINQFRK